MKKQVITSERIPIYLWLDEIEESAVQQAKNLANLPFSFRHIAIMADSHVGYGMPIGGVLATEGNIVIANAVGVDIGCGMLAIKTDIQYSDEYNTYLPKIVKLIQNRIPVGFSWNPKPADRLLMPDIDAFPDDAVVRKNFDDALLQLGTLGGGNHFIEIQKGDDDNLWFMIHSGSRNLGKKTADEYNKIAVCLNEKWHSSVPKEHQLAFLPLDEKEGREYMAEMTYCVEFALANRQLMAERIKNIICEVFPFPVQFDQPINIAHNYARIEHHFGKNVMIHRKGATSARVGEMGIIPGSQGTKSYIVEGLGNPESFMSCSHGAGRKMGRKQAQRELNLEQEIDLMNKQGIIHGIKTIENLDEAAGAYKDIDVVMENQKDLVKILVELKPLAVIKG